MPFTLLDVYFQIIIYDYRLLKEMKRKFFHENNPQNQTLESKDGEE